MSGDPDSREALRARIAALEGDVAALWFALDGMLDLVRDGREYRAPAAQAMIRAARDLHARWKAVDDAASPEESPPHGGQSEAEEAARRVG
jgi:hypothetical protein